MPSTRCPRVSLPARADAAADEMARHDARAAGHRNCAGRRRRWTWLNISTNLAYRCVEPNARRTRFAIVIVTAGMTRLPQRRIRHARRDPSVPLPARTITASCSTIPRPARPPRSTRPRRRRSRPRSKATGWKLTDILVTHHHADHTGGIAELKEKYKCRVVAPAGEAAKIPAVDETVREGDNVKVGKLVGAACSRRRATPPGTSPTGFDARQARFRRRHAVLDRLRPRHRGHAGDDVGFAAEAARPAGRHAGLLRPRIHAGQHQLRADHRAEQHGAAGARREAQKQIADGQLDHPDHASTRRRRPTCSCAPTSPAVAAAVGMAGKPAAEVFAEIRARKNKF